MISFFRKIIYTDDLENLQKILMQTKINCALFSVAKTPSKKEIQIDYCKSLAPDFMHHGCTYYIWDGTTKEFKNVNDWLLHMRKCLKKLVNNDACSECDETYECFPLPKVHAWETLRRAIKKDKYFVPYTIYRYWSGINKVAELVQACHNPITYHLTQNADCIVENRDKFLYWVHCRHCVLRYLRRPTKKKRPCPAVWTCKGPVTWEKVFEFTRKYNKDTQLMLLNWGYMAAALNYTVPHNKILATGLYRLEGRHNTPSCLFIHWNGKNPTNVFVPLNNLRGFLYPHNKPELLKMPEEQRRLQFAAYLINNKYRRDYRIFRTIKKENLLIAAPVTKNSRGYETYATVPFYEEIITAIRAAFS